MHRHPPAASRSQAILERVGTPEWSVHAGSIGRFFLEPAIARVALATDLSYIVAPHIRRMFDGSWYWQHGKLPIARACWRPCSLRTRRKRRFPGGEQPDACNSCRRESSGWVSPGWIGVVRRLGITPAALGAESGSPSSVDFREHSSSAGGSPLSHAHTD